MAKIGKRYGGLGLLLAGVTLAASASPLRADDDPIYKTLIEKSATRLVTVKFVLKERGRWGAYDSEEEITAVMIDPKGLVLCSNAQMGGGGWRGGQSTPTDVKVLIGDDIEGLKSKVIARDTELGLAWVQIEQPGDNTFDHVDLSKAATPGLGQRLYTVVRMGRFFDRAPRVTEGCVSGRTTKPRKLVVAGGAIRLETGLPVYTADGQVVGVAVVQQPDEEDVEHSSGGRYSLMGSVGSGLILPAENVLRATQRAKQLAAEEEAEEKEAEDGKPQADKDDDE